MLKVLMERVLQLPLLLKTFLLLSSGYLQRSILSFSSNILEFRVHQLVFSGIISF